MGRGNFWPGELDLNFVWYVDLDEPDIFKDELIECMFRIKDKFRTFAEDHGWKGDVEFLLSNGLYIIGVADNVIDNAITLQLRDDIPPEYVPLAKRHFDEYKRAISKILVEMFGDVRKYGGWFCHAALGEGDI